MADSGHVGPRDPRLTHESRCAIAGRTDRTASACASRRTRPVGARSAWATCACWL